MWPFKKNKKTDKLNMENKHVRSFLSLSAGLSLPQSSDASEECQLQDKTRNCHLPMEKALRLKASLLNHNEVHENLLPSQTKLRPKIAGCAWSIYE